MRTVEQLTDMQRAFVLHFVSTTGAVGNAAQAARLAGYAEKHAKEQGCQLLRLPHIRAAIDAANREQLSGPIASKAVALLERVIDDEDAPMRVRVDAAKTILDRAGLQPPNNAERAAAAEPEAKKMAEMSLAELQAFITSERATLDKMDEAAKAVTPIEAARTPRRLGAS